MKEKVYTFLHYPNLNFELILQKIINETIYDYVVWRGNTKDKSTELNSILPNYPYLSVDKINTEIRTDENRKQFSVLQIFIDPNFEF